MRLGTLVINFLLNLGRDQMFQVRSSNHLKFHLLQAFTYLVYLLDSEIHVISRILNTPPPFSLGAVTIALQQFVSVEILIMME